MTTTIKNREAKCTTERAWLCDVKAALEAWSRYFVNPFGIRNVVFDPLRNGFTKRE
jgi:hypothetical protein